MQVAAGVITRPDYEVDCDLNDIIQLSAEPDLMTALEELAAAFEHRVVTIGSRVVKSVLRRGYRSVDRGPQFGPMRRERRGTTEVGSVSARGQVVIRNTGKQGNDHLQYVYQLGCSHCGHVYGANGSDIHDRKCPQC